MTMVTKAVNAKTPGVFDDLKNCEKFVLQYGRASDAIHDAIISYSIRYHLASKYEQVLTMFLYNEQLIKSIQKWAFKRYDDLRAEEIRKEIMEAAIKKIVQLLFQDRDAEVPAVLRAADLVEQRELKGLPIIGPNAIPQRLT